MGKILIMEVYYNECVMKLGLPMGHLVLSFASTCYYFRLLVSNICNSLTSLAKNMSVFQALCAHLEEKFEQK